MSREILRDIPKIYEFISGHSADVVWVLDLEDLRFTYVSDSIRRYGSLTPEVMARRGPAGILTPGSWSDAMKTLDEKLRDDRAGALHEPVYIDFEVDAGENRHFWFNASMSFIRDGDRMPIGVAGIARDVTGKMMSEKILERRELVLRSLVKTSPDAILLFDIEGDVIMANDRAASLYGQERGDLIGVNYLSFVVPGDRTRAKAIRKKLDDAGRINNYCFTFLKKGGDTFPAEFSMSLVRDPSGNVIATVAIFRDITYRLQAEKEIKSLEAELLDIFISRLSDREIELLHYLLNGYSWPGQKREIARAMDILPSTLDKFMSRIKEKMKLKDIKKIVTIIKIHQKFQNDKQN